MSSEVKCWKPDLWQSSPQFILNKMTAEILCINYLCKSAGVKETSCPCFMSFKILLVFPAPGDEHVRWPGHGFCSREGEKLYFQPPGLFVATLYDGTPVLFFNQMTLMFFSFLNIWFFKPNLWISEWTDGETEVWRWNESSVLKLLLLLIKWCVYGQLGLDASCYFVIITS